jgi:hypothetical protein
VLRVAPTNQETGSVMEVMYAGFGVIIGFTFIVMWLKAGDEE